LFWFRYGNGRRQQGREIKETGVATARKGPKLLRKRTRLRRRAEEGQWVSDT
jgi:hypothetical protein